MRPTYSTLHHRLSPFWILPLLAILLVFPLAARHLGLEYYIGFASRLLRRRQLRLPLLRPQLQGLVAQLELLVGSA